MRKLIQIKKRDILTFDYEVCMNPTCFALKIQNKNGVWLPTIKVDEAQLTQILTFLTGFIVPWASLRFEGDV